MLNCELKHAAINDYVTSVFVVQMFFIQFLELPLIVYAPQLIGCFGCYR